MVTLYPTELACQELGNDLYLRANGQRGQSFGGGSPDLKAFIETEIPPYAYEIPPLRLHWRKSRLKRMSFEAGSQKTTAPPPLVAAPKDACRACKLSA
jgi:hypothetical protein